MSRAPFLRAPPDATQDDASAAFYKHHGFMALPDSPLTLFLPLATVQHL